jgi:8-amino-7-oxononanoate synthase
MRDLVGELRRLEASGAYRRRRVLDGAQGAEVVADGRRRLNFSSNDYLGLAADARVVAAMRKAAGTYGAGSGAAHLISGHSRAHHELEEALAAFTRRPRALLFSTGYMANLGVLAALAGRGDTVIEDRLNHASLIDAARLCGARLLRYTHGVADAAEQRLQQARGEVLVATDGVFSMDGDLAPLPELARQAHAQGAWLMVDDAHGLGVLGATGRGTLEHFALEYADVPILMGTLGKALGVFGAFVAGSEDLIETLIQRARSYIYTTAPPPAVAAAAQVALAIVNEEPWRRARLAALVARFRSGASELGLPLMDSTTPIQPLLVGDSVRTAALGARLFESGLLVGAIRPPTVPAGTARLRLTFSAAHTEAQVDRLLAALEGVRADFAPS